MDVLAKYTRKLGRRGSGGDWDGDRGATYHARDRVGGTACERGEPDPPPRGGVSPRGWELLRGRGSSDVTCAACRRALGLAPLGD